MTLLDDARKRCEGIWEEAAASNALTNIHIAVQLERIAEALETIALTQETS